jgi:hypothetical protein
MANQSRIERKSFDPKTMDRNWDRSNDKYISMLTKQQQQEADRANTSFEEGFFRALISSLRKKP